MKIQSDSKILRATVQQASDAAKKSVDSIPALSEEQKKLVADAIDRTEISAIEVPNTFVYWLAVGAMAAVCGLIVLGGLGLAAAGLETPNFLQITLATAIGALAGMVVPTPKIN